MERISVKEYARKHKLSLFQVIKKINTGELRSESVEENGLKAQYVLVDKEDREASRKSNTAVDESENGEKRMSPSEEKLRLEIQSLRAELRALYKIVEECCKQSS